MSEGTAELRRRIGTAGELQSVVRTMKALAASSISQYEQSVLALADYYKVIEMGLGLCLRRQAPTTLLARPVRPARSRRIGAVVFGSDQGLVGQFNDIVVAHAIMPLQAMAGTPRIWAVGERVRARLIAAGLPTPGLLAVPVSVNAIAPLVGQILLESEAHGGAGAIEELYLFHNRPRPGAGFEPVSARLLPLDDVWYRRLATVHWPGNPLPEVMGDDGATLRGLIREYLFISLFRACAESLASENASRLAAMQRADSNIEDVLGELHSTFHRLRQSSIDEELFDVIAGFEALSPGRARPNTLPPRGDIT